MAVEQQQPVLTLILRYVRRHVPILWSERAVVSPSATCVLRSGGRGPGVKRCYEENAKMVVELTVCPADSSVEGKLGWLGEFGKCWVSNV